MSSQRLTGKVKSFDPVKGQGTITRDDGQGYVFVDLFGLNPGEELKIIAGVRVEFVVLPHTTGPRAEQVTVLSASKA